ncbi:MAG: SLC13 family permease, partial [Solirubrobacteraceae bacterium]
MSHATISFVVLGAAVVLFVWNRLPPEIVAVAAALALYATGVLESGQVVAGFGDPAVTFIASLFIVSEGLDATGVTAWAGQKLIAQAGTSPSRLLVLMMLLAAVVSALITPNGSVAALIPVAVVMAVRIKRAPSSFLMPLAFSASAGSMLFLTGSPVNVIVSEAAAEHTHHGFAYLAFVPVGIPLVLGTIVIVALLGGRLLPERRARTIPHDLSEHARTLVDQYGIDADVIEDRGLPEGLMDRESGVAEVVVPPRSDLLGARFFPGMVTSSGDLVVLAIQRNGEDREGDTALAVGDTLLLQGAWEALDENLEDPEILVVNAPQMVRRQAVPLGPGAKRAIAVLV